MLDKQEYVALGGNLIQLLVCKVSNVTPLATGCVRCCIFIMQMSGSVHDIDKAKLISP